MLLNFVTHKAIADYRNLLETVNKLRERTK